MTGDPKPIRLQVDDEHHLSALGSHDIDALVEHLQEKHISEMSLTIPFPYTRADGENFLAIADEATKTHGQPIHFAIRDAEGKLLGGCGFLSPVKGHCAEIGYWIGKSYWGVGITTRSVAALCEHAFEEWELVRISASVFVGNTASVRVLEKNGFEYEGTRKKFHKKGNTFIDSMLYALVR